MNNEFLIASIAAMMDGASTAHHPHPRHQVCASELCLPSRLASSSFMSREASMYAQSNCDAQKQRDLDEAAASPRSPRENEASLLRRLSTVSQRQSKPAKATPWRDPEPYEVYQAIEKKDLVYLMTVRDRAFRLLLRRTQGTTPLLYALRLGKSHREVAIVLLGSFSRYINNLDTEDFEQPTTRELLRALRTNLKLAIDYGLANEQTDLISSFMQALVMSEGDKWIKRNIDLTAIALRTGAASKPVQSARQAVHSFATRELSGAESIAGFDDYCANAAIDLIVLGAWSLVSEAIKADPLPTYGFARDDKTFKLFIEALHKHKNQMGKVRSKRLKWQLQSIEEVVEGRADTMRAKLMQLTELLDNELGSP